MKANTQGKVPENQNQIVDIHIAGASRKKFRIDGDDSKILELNPSDLGIADRLADAYPKLKELEERARKLKFLSSKKDGDEDELDFSEEDMKALKDGTTKFKEIDEEMRTLIDFIFDYGVSAICAESGTMYDPFNGVPRYEAIISSLSNVFESNLNREIRMVKARINQNTQKFTKKRHR